MFYSRGTYVFQFIREKNNRNSRLRIDGESRYYCRVSRLNERAHKCGEKDLYTRNVQWRGVKSPVLVSNHTKIYLPTLDNDVGFARVWCKIHLFMQCVSWYIKKYQIQNNSIINLDFFYFHNNTLLLYYIENLIS